MIYRGGMTRRSSNLPLIGQRTDETFRREVEHHAARLVWQMACVEGCQSCDRLFDEVLDDLLIVEELRVRRKERRLRILSRSAVVALSLWIVVAVTLHALDHSQALIVSLPVAGIPLGALCGVAAVRLQDRLLAQPYRWWARDRRAGERV